MNMEKVIEKKHGINASFLGEDEVGKFVAVPVQESREYLFSLLNYLEKDEVIEKKYNVKLSGRYDNFPYKEGDGTIIFKLYYKEAK